MVQPINYLGMMPKRDLGARFLEGLKIGGALGELEQAEQQRTAAAELKAKYATDLKVLLQNPSMSAFNEFALKYPSQREVIKDVAGRFSQEQLDNEFDIGAQVAVSLENQNPDVALNIVEKTIQARKTAGLPTTTYDQIQQILSNTEDPDRVNKAKAITNFSLTLLNPEKFGKVVSALEAQELRPEKLLKLKEEVKKYGEEIGLTKEQIKEVRARTKKLSTEQQKAVLELEALKATGGVDPAKKFDQEAKIRGEYQKRTGQYQELKGTFENINSSAAAQTGPGDIALITSFMKMLDPGSVVRETEFATARDTAGLYAQLENNLKKAKDGQFLNPKQRGEYVSLARQYLGAAERQAKQEENNLRVVVKNYKLNPENIFGAGRESVVVNGVTYERPAGFTDEQWMSYKRSQGVQ